MKYIVRTVLFLTVWLSLGGSVVAQEYPSRAIKLVVPGSPGGSPDTFARLYAARLTEILGQPVVVENIAGAASIAGTDRVAKARADGYTLLYGFNQVATMNPALYPNLPYKPQQDLAPISLTLDLAYVWIASPKFQANSMKELIALAKAKPGVITYATTGVGSAAHLGGLLLEKKSNIKLLHIPYKGGAPANSDLVAGFVDIKLDPIGASLPLIKSGNVKALAVSSSERLAVLPDVPTLSEASSVKQEIVGWHGIWAPAGTPSKIIAKLNSAIVQVTKSPDMQTRITTSGSLPVGSTPTEMANRIEKESAEWGALIKIEGITAEE